MSRSFKKVANVNDGTKMHKQIQQRRLRRNNTMRINADEEPYLEREIINKYNLKDWNWTDFSGNKENDKYKRK